MNQSLHDRINNHEAHVGVIGLGYVGLPLAIEIEEAGFPITGIDINQEKIDSINKGISYITDISDDILQNALSRDKLTATNDFSVVRDLDIILICVPTGLTEYQSPDLSHLEDVITRISKFIREGQLISIESTIYPGTTEDFIVPILQSSGLVIEQQLYLCHSPERIDPSNKYFNTKNITKVVGGIGPKSSELAISFYKNIVKDVRATSNIRTAELSKIHENAFRAVNIALVNELALLTNKMGIDVWEVLDASFTKPFGIMPFYPGPGVGGHCIPIDPHYLEWRARAAGFTTKLITIASEINRSMPKFVIQRAQELLNNLGVSLSQAVILLIGMAYKKDINDTRESPACKVAESLLEQQASLIYHDSFVPQITIGTHLLTSVELTEENVLNADLVIITADHSYIDYQWLVHTASAILDTRNATKFVSNRENTVTLL